MPRCRMSSSVRLSLTTTASLTVATISTRITPLTTFLTSSLRNSITRVSLFCRERTSATMACQNDQTVITNAQ
ncbi:hypothetical protein EV127DRAFT_437439 [Xylaria flabelliformis]|nr:hypothetical protein EV127DRAFT_437439 [Xylaria flabelliformis]